MFTNVIFFVIYLMVLKNLMLILLSSISFPSQVITALIVLQITVSV